MNLTLQLYLGLIFILITFILGIGALVFIYFQLLKKCYFLERQIIEKEEAVNKQTIEILEKAQEEYGKTISEATQRAKEIVQKANQVKKLTEKSLVEALEELDIEQQALIEKTSQDILKKYRLKVNEAKIDTINQHNNVSNTLARYSQNTVDDYKTVFKKETVASQKSLEKRFDEEYKLLEEKLKAYEAEKLKVLDLKIIGVINDVVKTTIGKVISAEDHKDLIIQALENAKQKGRLS